MSANDTNKLDYRMTKQGLCSKNGGPLKLQEQLLIWLPLFNQLIKLYVYTKGKQT